MSLFQPAASQLSGHLRAFGGGGRGPGSLGSDFHSLLPTHSSSLRREQALQQHSLLESHTQRMGGAPGKSAKVRGLEREIRGGGGGTV